MCFIYLLYFLAILILVGQDDARSISTADGEALEEKEYYGEELEEDENDNNVETEIAGKYVRFFTHTEGDSFSIFVECGLQRTITETVVAETLVEITVTIPIPPDALLQTAGYHASTSSLQAVKSTFYFDAPRRLLDLTTLKYPNEKTPLWLIFKYNLEVDKLRETTVVDVDMYSTIFGEKAKEIK